MQNSAIFNTECSSQTDKNSYNDHCKFGFKPLGEFELPDIFQTHYMIRTGGVQTDMQCRIPVKSNLNPEKWRLYLKDYCDQQLLDLLIFVDFC